MPMADAPAAIRTLVEEHATGAIVGAFLTAGVHAFPPGEDGSWNTAAIWAVATSQQFWLVAHLRGQHWMIAVGRSSAVRLNEGWRWDSLEVDPWRIPLKRGGRSEARDLLGRWTLLEPAGQSWPTPPTLPVDRGIAAPGAWTLPDWWVSLVPAPADSHWFFCVQTRQLCPFNDWDGTIHEVPFWLGISDQSILLVARSPWNTLHIVALTQTPTLQKRRGELTFGLRTLRCRPQRLASRVAAFARATTPQLRWHTAIDQSLSAFEPSRAVALLHHARSLGHSEVCWAGIARLALACEQVETAVYGFSQLLAADPSFTLPSHWPGDHDALVRGLRREELDWIDVRTGLGFAANAHKSPLPVAGLPWPPVGFEECWWAALAATEQQDVARSAWLTRPLNGRSARALAALLGSSSPQDKAQAWQKAAEINWNEGQGSTAMECIQTAIGLVPSSRAWWMRGAWAWHLGGLRDAKEAWKEALNGDPTGSDWGDYPLAPDALCALAHLAQANSCHALADTAWEQCIRQDPARYDERLAWVAHRDQCLGQPGRAAALLDDTIVLLDQDGTEAPGSPRWALRCEQARLHIAAQENEKAIHALHDAIQSSVLELEAWDAILALAPGVVDSSTVQWWQHLQGCLAGGTENPDMQPSPVSPGPEELDALHPGGSGWLDRIRAALNPSEPPSFDTLTRGLDSLSDAGADLAQSTGDTLCERLDMPVPATLVYRGRSAFGASAWPSSPPVLLVGWTHLAPGDHPQCSKLAG